MTPPDLLEFVWLPSFERSAHGWLTFRDRRAIEALLCEDPGAGPIIIRTGGCRKLRLALRKRGKSGSARVIYFLDEAEGRVYMIFAYRKGRTAKLSARYEGELHRLAKTLLQGDR